MLEPIEIDPKTFLRTHCELPALPEVTLKVQKVLGNSDIDLEEIADLISGDPALLGQILKVVNSAYFGFQKEVCNVKFAIGYLGLNEIHRIMLAFAVANTLKIEGNDDFLELWFHSFHTALCATFLAKRNRVDKLVDDIWTAALLHDIGKLVYLKFFPDHFKEIKTIAHEAGNPFSMSEIELNMPKSADLGTLLCDHWKLPLSVRGACELHTLENLYEADTGVSFDVTSHLVCIGNLLSCLSTDPLSDDSKKEIKEASKKALDYNESKFISLLEEVEDMKVDAEIFKQQFR